MLCLPAAGVSASSTASSAAPIHMPLPSYSHHRQFLSSSVLGQKAANDKGPNGPFLDPTQSLENPAATAAAIAVSQQQLRDRLCTTGTPSPSNSGNSDSGQSSSGTVASCGGAGYFNVNHCPLVGNAHDLSSTIMGEPYSDSQSNAKSLLHNSLPSHYYNTGMYSQSAASIPYATIQPTAATSLYGAGTQSYYAATRALKGTGSYSLGSYFGATGGSTTPPAYYGAGGYPTTDYGSYAAAAYHQQSASMYAAAYPYGTSAVPSAAAAAAAATYQLAQLPPCTSTVDEHTLLAPSAIHPFAKPEKKTKGKKKKQAAPSPSPESQFERVFIWELEDACLMSAALISGTYASKYQKDPTNSVSIGYRIEELVCLIATNSFSSGDLDDCDQVHIDDVSIEEPPAHEMNPYGFPTGADGLMGVHHGGVFNHQSAVTTHLAAAACLASNGAAQSAAVRGGVDWMRKLAYRYKHIRDVYSAYRNDPATLVSASAAAAPTADKWVQLKAEYDQATDNWSQLAVRALTLVNSRPRYTNVIVTQYPLVQTLAKLLVYGLSPTIPIENVYSFSKVGRDACVERIQNRFGKKCTFVSVGASTEHESIAKQNQIPFWRVTDHSALQALYSALEMDHL